MISFSQSTSLRPIFRPKVFLFVLAARSKKLCIFGVNHSLNLRRIITLATAISYCISIDLRRQSETVLPAF